MFAFTGQGGLEGVVVSLNSRNCDRELLGFLDLATVDGLVSELLLRLNELRFWTAPGILPNSMCRIYFHTAAQV